jgi:hypothetical protein
MILDAAMWVASEKPHAQWEKADTEDRMLYDSICMECLE